MKNKRFWYDISETGDYTEYKSKEDVINHLTNALTDKEKQEINGSLCYRQWSNSETIATYEIQYNRKGKCNLVKIQ